MGEINELDSLLKCLRQAQADGKPDEELAAIRKQIKAAGDREAAAQEVARKQAGVVAGKRLQEEARLQPASFRPTPPIDRCIHDLAHALIGTELEDYSPAILAVVRPFILLDVDSEVEKDADLEGPLGASLSRDQPKTIEAKARAEARRKREESLPAGASRFGFVPDLPPDLAWPLFGEKRFMFLAQIDLEQVPYWEGSPLPKDGWLYFFYKWGWDGSRAEDPYTCYVLHHRCPRTTLVRATVPESADDIWTEDPQHEQFMHGLLPLKARVGITIDHATLAKTCPDIPMSSLDELLEQQADRQKSKNMKNVGRLIGEDYELAGTAAENVEQVLNFGHDPVVERIRSDPRGIGNDWMNLLFVQSAGSMMWSDVGFLFFLARQSDLLARDYSRIVMEMWCT